MEINITSRHVEIDDKLRAYVREKIERLEKYNKSIVDARVIFEGEKFRLIAEITINVKNARLTAKEESTDLYAALDNAVESMKNQLARQRDRIKKRKRQVVWGRISRPIKEIFTFQKPPETRQGMRIVKSDQFAPKPMMPEDAALELAVSKNNFIVFKNASTEQVNVLHKRSNGEYGLIEPEF